MAASFFILPNAFAIVACRYYHGPQHAQRVESAWNIASSCDVLVFVVDAHRQLLRPDPRVERQLAVLGTADSLPPTALILNKVDAVAKKQRGMLLSLADDLKEMANISELFWVSARRGHGMEGLKEWLLGQAKPGSWILSADASTNLSDLDLACELVREKIFRAYYEGKLKPCMVICCHTTPNVAPIFELPFKNVYFLQRFRTK